MSILAPALTGTVLVPILTSQLEKTFGIDLSDIQPQLMAEFDSIKKKNGKGKKKRHKKNKSRKGAAKEKKKPGSTFNV